MTRFSTSMTMALAALAGGCAFSKEEARDATWALPSHAAFAESVERVEFVTRFGCREVEVHAVRRDCVGTKRGTLVLVHGYPASLFTWADVMSPPASRYDADGDACQQRAMRTLGMTDLASRFDLLALDLPGHGFTKIVDGPAASEDLLEPSTAGAFLLQVVEELVEDGPVWLVGHSFGGLVCCYAADRWRQRQSEGATDPVELRGLALLSPEGVYRSEEELLPGEDPPWWNVFERVHWLARLCGELVDWFPIGWDGNVEAGIQNVSTVDRLVTADQLESYSLNQKVYENFCTSRYLVRRSRVEDLATIARIGDWDRRVALLWGSADALFPMPKHSDVFERQFAKGDPARRSMRVVTGAGHILTEDSPAQVVGWLIEECDG